MSTKTRTQEHSRTEKQGYDFDSMIENVPNITYTIKAHAVNLIFFIVYLETIFLRKAISS